MAARPDRKLIVTGTNISPELMSRINQMDLNEQKNIQKILDHFRVSKDSAAYFDRFKVHVTNIDGQYKIFFKIIDENVYVIDVKSENEEYNITEEGLSEVFLADNISGVNSRIKDTGYSPNENKSVNRTGLILEDIDWVLNEFNVAEDQRAKILDSAKQILDPEFRNAAPKIEPQITERFNQRADKGENAPTFIARVYANLLTGDFTRADLRKIDGPLEMALRNWERRHKQRAAINLPTVRARNDRLVQSGEIVTTDPIETARRAAAAANRARRKHDIQ